MARKSLIVALTLPLVVIVLGIVKAEWHLAHARTWLFDVSGYDPRDLLRGHYLRYRLDLHEGSPLEACEPSSGGDCCLCLTHVGDDVPPRVERASCTTARARCEGVLAMRYLDELGRYYVAEAEAQKLEQKLRDGVAENKARVVLAIDGAGKPAVRGMQVRGVPIEQAK